MKTNPAHIRIGRINYTNVWPIMFDFPSAALSDRIELTEQVPSTLNRAMAAGEIDMGPISSFAYAANANDYVLLPNLSVSAFGKVRSILLFHKKPLHELHRCRIAMTTASATSVHLLQVLMRKWVEVQPEYVSAAPNLEKMMESADAALLIGDDAIQNSFRDTGYMVTDLSEAWNTFTGHFMTFAVWAVRKDAIERDQELVSRIYYDLVRSKEVGLTLPESLLGRAQTEIGGTESYWRDYFGGLCYDFGTKQQDGLELYFRYCYDLGFLESPVRPVIWQHPAVTRVNE